MIASEKLLRRTTEITARLGVEFGLRYRIVGAPKGAKVPVKIVTIYPGDGLRNPKADKADAARRAERGPADRPRTL